MRALWRIGSTVLFGGPCHVVLLAWQHGSGSNRSSSWWKTAVGFSPQRSVAEIGDSKKQTHDQTQHSSREPVSGSEPRWMLAESSLESHCRRSRRRKSSLVITCESLHQIRSHSTAFQNFLPPASCAGFQACQPCRWGWRAGVFCGAERL